MKALPPLRTTGIWTLALVALCSASMAQAHHSNVAFETETISEVSGTVADWRWTNPHTWLVITVEDSVEGSTEWSFEGRPPGLLARMGWSPKMFSKGDKVTIHFSPAKDKSHTGLIARVTLSDGTILQYSPTGVR